MLKGKPLLATGSYLNLDGGFKTAQDWLAEWKAQAKAGRSAMLVSLLHWGLRLPDFGGPVMICHYLEVANGHASESNFGEDEYRSLCGVLCDSKRYSAARTVRQLISEKAWTELCNRFFEVGDSPYYEPVHRTPLLHQAVVDKLLWFFGDADSGGSSDDNLPRYGSVAGNNYTRRARSFLRSFLTFGWNAGGNRGLNAEAIYGDRPSKEERQRCIEMMAYYHNLRPSLIDLMAQHRMLGLLHRMPLDLPSRRKLKELALTPEYSHLPKPGTLVQAFVGSWGSGRGSFTQRDEPESKYPEAAEILLLYPHLLKALRKSRQSERVRQQREEENRLAQEQAQAEQQLKLAQDRLAELRVR
ncbi:MAG: hypothetical protein ACM3NH_02755 [Candidatus Saccharibacteria bacterium]